MNKQIMEEKNQYTQVWLENETIWMKIQTRNSLLLGVKHLLWYRLLVVLWFLPEHGQHNAALHSTRFCLLWFQNSCLPRYSEDTAMKVYNKKLLKLQKQINVTN